MIIIKCYINVSHEKAWFWYIKNVCKKKNNLEQVETLVPMKANREEKTILKKQLIFYSTSCSEMTHVHRKGHLSTSWPDKRRLCCLEAEELVERPARPLCWTVSPGSDWWSPSRGDSLRAHCCLFSVALSRLDSHKGEIKSSRLSLSLFIIRTKLIKRSIVTLYEVSDGVRDKLLFLFVPDITGLFLIKQLPGLSFPLWRQAKHWFG